MRRVAGSLIDVVVLLGVLFAGLLFFGVAAGSETAFVGFMVVWFVAAFVYDPICHAVSGQTFGKRRMGTPWCDRRANALASSGRSGATWRSSRSGSFRSSVSSTI